MKAEEGRRPGFALACASFLILLGVVIHHSALSGWWLYDDPALLIEAIRQPLRGVFTDPAEYAHLATHTFVPLQLVSYKIDLALGGLSPRVFYAHQVIALIAAAVLLFFVLRRYASDVIAVLGAATFLSTWAAVYAARTLMIRHYVEGLGLALVALLCWQRKRDGAGAVFYLLALLAKEVYAPIPLLLALDARGRGESWTEVGRRLIAPAVTFGIFMIWRWWMTGLVGGYNAPPAMRDVAHLPATLWMHLVGPLPEWPRPIWGICVAFLILLLLLKRGLKGVAFMAVILLAAILPVVPLAANFEWRFSFAFTAFVVGSLTFCAGVGPASAGLSSSRRLRWPAEAGPTLVLLLFLVTAFTAFPQRRYYENLTRRGIEQEGRYVWEQPRSAAPIAVSAPEWYTGSIAWLRRWSGRGDAPPVIYSQYAITTGAVDGARVVTVLPKTGQLVPLSQTTLFGTPAQWQGDAAQRDDALPLSIDFSVTHHDARWNLGPPGGNFTFLTDDGYTAIFIPPSGERRVPAARERQYFRIRRDDTTGRWTISPRLPVPFEGERTVWHRP